jgi:hypothetical protein
MKHLVEERAVVEAVKAHVDATLGYPRLGRNALTGESVQPPPGRPIEEAPGVTLTYAAIEEHPSKDGRFSYPVNETSRPIVEALKAEIAKKPSPSPTEVKVAALVEADRDATWEKARVVDAKVDDALVGGGRR